ncbi:hypothetical protein XENOCAPTIV_019035 [Xenoophorus captivus]|uniref:NADH dehydrogenase subunit 4L n=1 Tax=Xenoophorus captivus TaxID=1517983 RepID=A0ABV0QBK5_9TELE
MLPLMLYVFRMLLSPIPCPPPCLLLQRFPYSFPCLFFNLVSSSSYSNPYFSRSSGSHFNYSSGSSISLVCFICSGYSCSAAFSLITIIIAIYTSDSVFILAIVEYKLFMCVTGMCT